MLCMKGDQMVKRAQYTMMRCDKQQQIQEARCLLRAKDWFARLVASSLKFQIVKVTLLPEKTRHIGETLYTEKHGSCHSR